MDHLRHRPGPVKDCVECRQMAYEPTWYAALVAFDVQIVHREPVTA